MTVVELAHQPRVAVGAGLFNDEGKFLDNLVVLIDLDDPRIAGFTDHRVSVVKPLERMNLNAALGVGRFGNVRPYHLLVRRDFLDRRVTHVRQDIPVWQQLDVMRRILAGHLPFHLTLGIHNRNMPVIPRQHLVIRPLLSAGKGSDSGEQKSGGQLRQFHG